MPDTVNFPTTGLTTNVSTYTLGTRTWLWNGAAWEIVTQTITGYTGSAGVGYTGSAGSTFTLYWDLGNQNITSQVAIIESGDQTRYITNIFDSGGTS